MSVILTSFDSVSLIGLWELTYWNRLDFGLIGGNQFCVDDVVVVSFDVLPLL